MQFCHLITSYYFIFGNHGNLTSGLYSCDIIQKKANHQREKHYGWLLLHVGWFASTCEGGLLRVRQPTTAETTVAAHHYATGEYSPHRRRS